jgi:hypothetical protein
LEIAIIFNTAPTNSYNCSSLADAEPLYRGDFDLPTGNQGKLDVVAKRNLHDMWEQEVEAE